MKVIDLLNKIANGEEVPKKIKYKDDIYEYYETSTSIDYRCYDEKTELHGYLSSCVDYNSFKCLNDEIEIIEEEKKIPEKLDINLGIASMTPTEKYISNTVNEIIDYLKSKGDE